MGGVEMGLVLPLLEDPGSGEKPTWDTIERMANTARETGFDTVWVPDELLWRPAAWPGPRGWWECVAVAGAVAASTSAILVGSWVLSALHRNPGLTVKVAMTLDEVSRGRFVFGLGAGHAGPQGAAFGFPPDNTVSRYADALEIIVPALRGERVTTDGTYHGARDLEIRPTGPSGGRIPLMLAGHGPRTMRLAARHGDIWSGYATESSQAEWFRPMIDRLEEACADVERDPATLERSIGVVVEPTERRAPGAFGYEPISGSVDQIADGIGRFAEVGATRVELMLQPNDPRSLEAVAPAIGQLVG